MKPQKTLAIIGMAIAATVSITSGQAQAADSLPNPLAALNLAHQLSSSAARAELGVPANDINVQVTAALQTVIIGSGAEPRLVLMALQDVDLACRPDAGKPSGGWSCPGSPGAYDALRSLQSLVVAQLDQSGVAAIGTFGPAAFGTIPLTSPGGAGYITP
jgi:hypothetical protein